jgi:hypothetical protein
MFFCFFYSDNNVILLYLICIFIYFTRLRNFEAKMTLSLKRVTDLNVEYISILNH